MPNMPSPISTKPTRIAPVNMTATVVLISDRKSTRLNSSHMSISYAVFCLEKKLSAGQVSAELRDGERAAPLHRCRDMGLPYTEPDGTRHFVREVNPVPFAPLPATPGGIGG